MRLRKLSYAGGAEITGIKLSADLPQSVIDDLRSAWLEHHVLVFPDQQFTIDEHIRFSRRFGELELHPLKSLQSSIRPEIFEITNETVGDKPSETGEIGRQWHSDGAFTIANAEAIRADISFDRLNYVLKSEGGIPVWRIELLDGPASVMGSLKIAADTGTVIERSPQLALSEDDRRDEKWSKPGEKFKSVADFFHRTGKKLERTGYQLRNWASGDGWTDAKNP